MLRSEDWCIWGSKKGVRNATAKVFSENLFVLGPPKLEKMCDQPKVQLMLPAKISPNCPQNAVQAARKNATQSAHQNATHAAHQNATHAAHQSHAAVWSPSLSAPALIRSPIRCTGNSEQLPNPAAVPKPKARGQKSPGGRSNRQADCPKQSEPGHAHHPVASG